MNTKEDMLEHWPLSETKIQVAPNCGRAWAEWISHGLEIPARGYGEVRGIVLPIIRKRRSRSY